MVMYRVYNAETLEKFIDTIHRMHNTTAPNERLFMGELSTAFTRYVNKNRVDHYAINSFLFLRTLKEKYAIMAKEFVLHLCMYTKAMRVLPKGYLPISLISP